MVKRAPVYADFKGNKTSEWKKHFTEQLDFKHVVLDPATKEETTKTITNMKTKTNIKDLIMDRVGPLKDQQTMKKAGRFADLLDQMLALDPERRQRSEVPLVILAWTLEEVLPCEWQVQIGKACATI